MARHSEQGGARGTKDDAERIPRLEQDVERLLREGGPTDEELAAAPVLSRWTLIIHPSDGLPALVGSVTGHPEVRSGPVVTSPVVVIALEAGWARTVSRMYALGVPADETLS